MTENSDLEKLASRYLDLWQNQIASWIHDPKIIDMISQSYVNAQKNYPDLYEVIQKIVISSCNNQHYDGQNNEDHRGEKNAAYAKKNKSSQDRASSSASPSPDAIINNQEFTKRLTDLEKRLSRLEKALTTRSSRSPRINKKSSSKPVSSGY
jgi:hypothetical protein